MSADDPTVYTVNDVARILGMDPNWVQRKAGAGVIPSRKVGRHRRFTAQDIADYLESVRQQAANPLARNARQTAARNRRRKS